MNEQFWWYLSRASGLVAWVLLVGSLVWGVLLATRALKPLDRPAWLLAMHRWISGLAVVATAVHLGALVADGYVQFGAKELFVPMASNWQPGAVTVGIIGLYVLVLVQVTSLMMKKLPKRLWRWIHMTSYVMVWTVTVHAGMAGTDVTNRVYQGVALLLTIAAVSVTVLRIIVGRRGGAGAPASNPAARSVADAAAHAPVSASPAPVSTAPASTREERIAKARATAAAQRSGAPATATPLPPPVARDVVIVRPGS